MSAAVIQNAFLSHWLYLAPSACEHVFIKLFGNTLNFTPSYLKGFSPRAWICSFNSPENITILLCFQINCQCDNIGWIFLIWKFKTPNLNYFVLLFWDRVAFVAKASLELEFKISNYHCDKKLLGALLMIEPRSSDTVFKQSSACGLPGVSCKGLHYHLWGKLDLKAVALGHRVLTVLWGPNVYTQLQVRFGRSGESRAEVPVRKEGEENFLS